MCKVSVIVPVYNVEDYIRECLDSLINQTLTDIEIILVDDGSKDLSGDICDEYAKKDCRIKVIHKENGGQSSARNAGLKVSTGEYILFVDSDDYIVENTLETLLNEAKKNDADIVHGDIKNDDQSLEDKEFRKLNCDYKKVTCSEFLKEKIRTETYDIVPVLYFVRKKYLEKNNIIFLEDYFYEDQLWTMELLSRGGSIVKIRFTYYYYRMDRPGSTTNHMYQKKGTDAAVICNKMADYINNYGDEECKKQLKAILLMSVYQFTRVWLRLSGKDRKISWRTIDKDCFLLVLECEGAYKQLKEEILKFYKNKELQAIKYDIKNLVRKMIKR